MDLARGLLLVSCRYLLANSVRNVFKLSKAALYFVVESLTSLSICFAAKYLIIVLKAC